MSGVGGPLFSLACRHEYFSDRVCRPLTVRASPAGALLLRRYRMLLRPLPGGAAVYCQDGAALAGYDETAALTFTLENSDPFLMNYTAVDATRAGAAKAGPPTVWYFDNRADQAGLLNPSGTLSPALALMPRRFHFPLERPREVGQLALFDNFERRVLAAAPAAPLRAVELDLAGFPDGRYRLELDGQNALEFYLSDAPAARVWGVVALYLGGSRQAAALPQGCPIGAAGAPAPRDYVIALPNRHTIWRYTVVAPAGAAPDYAHYAVQGSAIGPGAPAIAFAGEPELLSVNGRPAARFASLDVLPLREAAARHMRVSLQSGDQALGGATTTPLPYARGDVLALPDPATPGRAYSDIYVYL